MPKPVSKQTAPKQVSAEIKYDFAQRCPYGFFNTFSIDDVAGQVLLEFGLLRGRSPLFAFRCLVLKETLDRGRESMLQFLGTMPEEVNPITECAPMPLIAESDTLTITNFMSVTRFGNLGEIRLGQFSFGLLVESSRSAAARSVLNAQPVAVLSCELPLLRHFLTSLFIPKTK